MMPTYTFELRDGSDGIPDGIGISLPGRRHALAYACDVVRELMAGREASTRYWRLDVYENEERVIEIPFASMDRSLDQVTPELRSVVEGFCERRRSLLEMISEARATVRESQALIARSRGKPYLAVQYGEPTIRP